MNERIRVGLLGCGTVGDVVAHRLSRDPRLVSAYEVAAIAVCDLRRMRRPGVDRSLLTDDSFAVAADPAIDVVVEVMGGVTDARDAVTMALRRGASVVSANKALFASQGAELESVALHSGAFVRFSAAVGGGVPMLEVVTRIARTDDIVRLEGVFNGTSNFVLNRMAYSGTDIATAVSEAQQAGYAEADPTRDLDGTDTAEKLILLARAAWNRQVSVRDVQRVGIAALAQAELRRAARAGRSYRLVGTATPDGDLVVEPRHFPADNVLARLQGPQNALVIASEHAPPVALVGDGAGGVPTAAAIIADLDAVSCALVR